MSREHELWAAAQLAPGEGIEDGVARIAAILRLAAPQPEPVAWQFRWTNPGNNPHADPLDMAWKPVAPKYNSIDDEVANLRAYRFDGKPCYEVRALYAAPPAAPAPAVREPLTEDAVSRIWREVTLESLHNSQQRFARAIEQAHGIGGGGNG